MDKKAKIVIIAGPNGAGKTTFAREFLPKEGECPDFINMDLIASGLSPFAPDKAAGHCMTTQGRSPGFWKRVASMNRNRPAISPEIAGELRALRRAAKRALEIGLMNGTPVWVMIDGKMVDLAKRARRAGKTRSGNRRSRGSMR